jgi:hypothetical protein
MIAQCYIIEFSENCETQLNLLCNIAQSPTKPDKENSLDSNSGYG